MNEAQTLLEIENFMLKVSKRRYRWNDFEAEFDELKRKASTVYHSEYEYSPLIQSYFDLLLKIFLGRIRISLNISGYFNAFSGSWLKSMKTSWIT